MKKRIIAIGEVLFDDFGTHRCIGGAAANFAVHLAQLGADAALLSAVGDDADGREIVKFLDSFKVDTSLISRVSFPTGRVEVVMKNAIPSYNIIEGSAWDNIPVSDVNISAIAKADVVYFGSLAQRSAVSASAIKQLIGSATPDALIVFDINLRQHYFSQDIIEKSLASTNILKISDEELPVVAKMFGLPSGNEGFLLGICDKFGLDTAILTMGKHGSLTCCDKSLYREEEYPCVCVDTVGAGDSFTAAFIYSLLAGDTVAVAQHKANRMAAFVCSQKGATPKLTEDVKQAIIG